MSSSCREKREPSQCRARTRMVNGSPSPPSVSLAHPLGTSAMLLAATHRWGLNPVHPTLSLGHSWEPTSPSSTLQGPAIAWRASEPQQRRATHGLHCGHQPRDSAAGMTAASALPPGARSPCPGRFSPAASGDAGEAGTGGGAGSTAGRSPAAGRAPIPAHRNWSSLPRRNARH